MIMKKYDESVRTNHDPKWTYILNILHKILIIAGSGSGKTNVLLNLEKVSRKVSVRYQWKKRSKD